MKPRDADTTLLILILGLLFVSSSCDRVFRKDGVGEFLALKFGVPLALKIREGPREPPFRHTGLVEFYEVDFSNMEFNFIGVAVTKNSDKNKKEGVHFKRENIIWGAMFHNNNACDEKLFEKTKGYIAKKWNVISIHESRNEPGASFFVNDTYYSPGVIWELTCGAGLGLSVVIYDYSVLKNEGDTETKQLVEKEMSELLEVMKRKM